MSESDVHLILSNALDADESGNFELAFELYTKSVEVILSIDDPQVKARLNKFALQSLDRAEKLKQKLPLNSKTLTTAAASKSNQQLLPSSNSKHTISTGVKSIPSSDLGSSSTILSLGLGVVGNRAYTDAEKKVLQHTSHINQHVFVPFMSIDLHEKFVYSIPFTDKDGHLPLAPKQRQNFVSWQRISELHPEPQLVANNKVDFYSIKQTVVSDCSFVASLAVAAQYERRFGRRLVTEIIFPRNSRDEPIYNSSGKYSIRLHINGIPRKVIIDDYLPVGKFNQLLCSFSSNKNEFWVSLLEKAYMKVMGGYDFPGSNSSIDLHALTGWIPERQVLRSNDEDFNADYIFNRIKAGLDQGRCLITCATGELTDEQTNVTGLVATHAYAVLDLREVEGVKLVLLKNPWSHLRWKGNYSELDIVHWTPELQSQLNYDPKLASQVDNGVFWIDYRSILNFFDVFYISWDPKLFQYTYSIHQKWSNGIGPIKDAYTVGDNPQYILSVPAGRGSVWVLLTRHITTVEDFRQNKEYITLLVYQNQGTRVYYPNDPRPYIDGVRINSPHYLCKIKLDPNQAKRFTLVISQYEKSTTIYYTLRAFCRDPFELKPMFNYPSCEVVNGEWKAQTAGGCQNHQQTYKLNPKYRVQLSGGGGAGGLGNETFNLVVELRGPKVYQVGLEATVERLNDDTATATFVSKVTGAYRSGFCVLEIDKLYAGSYFIIPSTYLPGQESPFILKFKSTSNLLSVELVK